MSGNSRQISVERLAAEYSAAWCSGVPERVAGFFEDDGQIIINNGDVLKGQAALTEMAAGFYAAFPDLKVICDVIRFSGSHALYAWTLEGHHAETKNFVRAVGWEEWELSESMKIQSSRGWFDGVEYQRQIDEGF